MDAQTAISRLHKAADSTSPKHVDAVLDCQLPGTPSYRTYELCMPLKAVTFCPLTLEHATSLLLSSPPLQPGCLQLATAAVAVLPN